MGVSKDEAEIKAGQGLVYGDVVSALYLGILGRPADKGGFESYLGGLQRGIPLSDIISEIIRSDEFRSHQQPALANSLGSSPRESGEKVSSRYLPELFNWLKNFLPQKELYEPDPPRIQEHLFQPALPLPQGITEQQLFNWLMTVRVAGASKEIENYCREDFKRFVYTWGLINNEKGKALELGSNPYFSTMLLRHHTKLELTLANYFGHDGKPKLESQNVHYEDPMVGDKLTTCLDYWHFNIETKPYPFIEGEFRIVFFCEIIEHLLNDPMFVLSEINRVLAHDGFLVLTTPNVSRLENVARMMSGTNIYDPYSGYGPYGRHNREYNKQELHLLLRYAGFEIENMFTADVHENRSSDFFDLSPIDNLLAFRRHDLGQYIFIKARKVGLPGKLKPSFLYRSYPENEMVHI